jgi:prophage regulatory protein
MALWKVNRLMDERAQSRSGVYAAAKDGLLTKPIKIGPRASAWPSEEVQTIARAQVAGWSDDQIRALVRQLEAARLADAPALAS